MGTAIALATFAFQTTQEWIGDGQRAALARWLIPTLVAVVTLCVGGLAYLAYWIHRSTERQADDADPYRAYAVGVIAYGRDLHAQQRDPAVLRLRDNSTLTLHVLGFHEERAQLGEWALESAQFVGDKLAIISILIDDLGWTGYLLRRPEAVANIEKAIRYADQLTSEDVTRRAILTAKAHRHLGVITTARRGTLAEEEFERAKVLLEQVSDPVREVRIELAHLAYAEALAIATMLRVNMTGSIRRTDMHATGLLARALDLVRQAKERFLAETDQGRYAKSLVLEVRVLEALDDIDDARHLAPLRDRAVAASVWARPAGAAFITGR